MQELLRQLPSVDAVAGRIEAAFRGVPRRVLVEEARRVIEELRGRVLAGELAQVPDPGPLIERAIRQLIGPSQVRVINATGVILHTNLGRAPLAGTEPLEGYTNLEYDVAEGRRGKRDAHVAGLLEAAAGRARRHPQQQRRRGLPGAARAGRREGSDCLPRRADRDRRRLPHSRHHGPLGRDARARWAPPTAPASRIIEQAISPNTALLLRVHPSNFRIRGFTGRPELGELVELARERGLPLYEDLGSGCLVDLRPYGIEEPLATASLKAGADLVSFSGDKLLGGPQAGIVAGTEDLVRRIRRNPMYRALRLDKLILRALETTLRHLLLEQWDQVPVLRMLAQTPDTIRLRARGLLELWAHPGAALVRGESLLGGGSTPGETLPTWLISLEGDDVVAWERSLREHRPPVIARIDEGRLLLDLRTVAEEEEPVLLAALRSAGEMLVP